tara:strand:+ start:1031 stop:1852 length:822 start_codon:yes stop_codon:yes gene_type:complete
MKKIYNYTIFKLIKLIVNIIRYKKKALYFKLITSFSIGDFLFSYDGLKIYISNSNKEDVTFRYVISGFYLNDYSRKLQFYNNDFCFIDIGSNIGFYSIKALKNKQCKGVISFEPNPKVFKDLKKNLKNNSIKKYYIFNYAISKHNSKSKLFINKEDTGSSSLNIPRNSIGKVINITTKNYIFFDKIKFKNFKGITKIFVKIDTEGHDINVLNQLKKSKIFNKVFNIYIETKNTKKNIKIIQKKLKNFSLISKNPIIENIKDNRLIDLEFERNI